MIEKYYNGVIEQIYNKLGKSDNNIVMVSYNNVFSISKLESVKRYLADDNVVFAYHEYEMADCVEHMNHFWIYCVICWIEILLI